MIRQDIRIGDYTDKGESLASYKFIVDLYKAGVDFNEDIKKNYVMIRKYNVVNEVVYDTDIYIIERDLVNDSRIAYPNTNGSFIGFSSDVTSFNENLTDKTYYAGGDEVYDILTRKDSNTNDFTIADVPCDKIRIYHPHNKTVLESVIYVDTQIRGVHFHLLCRPYSTYDTNAESDFEDEHLMYSEFIECWIPNIEWLMSGKAYYQEHISIIDVEETEQTAYLICSPDNKLADECYAALRIFSLPFRIDTSTDDEGNEIFVKHYMPSQNDDVAHDYITWPLRVTISPYSYVDESTHLYINDSTMAMNSDTMQEDAKMSLRATTGFDKDGNHSILAVFDFPHKSDFSSFREAYEYFYKVDLNDYTGIVEYDEDEDDEDEYVEQKQCGFILRIFSDANMTQKVGQVIYEIDNPSAQLDDFAFQTATMFDRWEQLPNILVFQCTFIDKWLGNVIKSNPVVISEESFKYFINDINKPVVGWDKDDKGKEKKQEIYERIEEMNKSKINFIDKITCTIRKSSEQTDTPSARSGAKVLYKPVFFRTQDLQTISLQSGIRQNIGVSLSEYMTKVETFKLTIGGVQIVESARNDIYVIFSIDASSVPSNSGTYYISNQDDEYISSGKYTVVD